MHSAHRRPQGGVMKEVTEWKGGVRLVVCGVRWSTCAAHELSMRAGLWV
jgi:hypothetical protein